MTSSFNRTANTKRNIIWGLFGRVVLIVGPFITRSFLIYNLGADYLGISSLYTSILQVLSLAVLGFATVVTYSMYEPISNGNIREVATTVPRRLGAGPKKTTDGHLGAVRLRLFSLNDDRPES